MSTSCMSTSCSFAQLNLTLIPLLFCYYCVLGIRHVLLMSGAGSTHLTQRQTEVVSSGTSGGIAATMATILSSKIVITLLLLL